MHLNDKPIIFDLSQTVLIGHPRAREFLKRDLKNLNRFFNKFGARTKDVEEVFKWVVKDG
jgi:RIO kinase 1